MIGELSTTSDPRRRCARFFPEKQGRPQRDLSAGAECTLSCSGNPAGRMSEVTDDEAARAVPLIDLALDGVGDVTRGGWLRIFGRTLPRLPARAEALLLHLFDHQVECLLEYCRHVSVRNSVAE